VFVVAFLRKCETLEDVAQLLRRRLLRRRLLRRRLLRRRLLRRRLLRRRLLRRRLLRPAGQVATLTGSANMGGEHNFDSESEVRLVPNQGLLSVPGLDHCQGWYE
jgi:hypothetical protein